MKKRHLLEATWEGYSPISWKVRDGATFRAIASWPMSAPGGRCWPGPRSKNLDPRSLPFPSALEAYRFLGEGKNAANLKQIRAAPSIAYKHWDLKNPFTKIEPPLQNEPQIRYLLLADSRRLLDYLRARQHGYHCCKKRSLTETKFK